MNNFNSHQEVLREYIEKTYGLIIEFGVGEGSTELIHFYNRHTISYENNKEYYDKFKHLKSAYHSVLFVKDWNEVKTQEADIVFIDHAPAARRHIDAIRFSKLAQYVIVHDTEHEGKEYDSYFIELISKAFKYKKKYSVPGIAAATNVYSNFHPL